MWQAKPAFLPTDGAAAALVAHDMHRYLDVVEVAPCSGVHECESIMIYCSHFKEAGQECPLPFLKDFIYSVKKPGPDP